MTSDPEQRAAERARQAELIRRTLADYTHQPWKNGKGVTVEMLRIETDAGLQYRISRASVVEAAAQLRDFFAQRRT